MQMIIDTSTIEQTHGFALSLKSLPFGRASRVEGYMSMLVDESFRYTRGFKAIGDLIGV